MKTIATIAMDRNEALQAMCAIIRADITHFHRRISQLFVDATMRVGLDSAEALAVWFQTGLSIVYHEVPATASFVPRAYPADESGPMRLTWEYRGQTYLELLCDLDECILRISHGSEKQLQSWQEASRLIAEAWLQAA